MNEAETLYFSLLYIITV